MFEIDCANESRFLLRVCRLRKSADPAVSDKPAAPGDYSIWAFLDYSGVFQAGGVSFQRSA
jgi:hypothetical protein